MVFGTTYYYISEVFKNSKQTVSVISIIYYASRLDYPGGIGKRLIITL